MKRALPLLALLGVLGCGAELNRSSEVEGLRVLGVHKSKSYARAGDEVTFSMLWHDTKGRDVTPVWFAASEAEVGLLAAFLEQQFGVGRPVPSGMSPWQDSSELMPVCANPPRDSYFGCLETHRQAFEGFDGAIDLLSQRGDSITLSVPSSIVSRPELPPEVGVPALRSCSEISDDYSCRSIYHPPPDTDDLPNFGSMFVFFALCPGTLTYDAGVKEGFGLLCLDADDRPLGPSDFVFGYSEVFLYEELANQNPVIDGMVVDGTEATACVGLDCLESDDRPEECADGIVCLDVCTEKDEDDCPEIDVKPLIPRTFACGAGECKNAEQDELAQLAYGRSYTEQMWIRYYADHGKMASEVKLLNDATTGWNADFGTKLRLPQEPGPLRLWAVVYDNRGGQNWVRVDTVVK